MNTTIKKINHLLILAPMAGITDLPFRLVCKEHGADVVYSEMISATGIYFNKEKPLVQNKSLQLAMTCAEEQPMYLQLFGREPEHFAFATRLLSDLPVADNTDTDDIKDITLGLYRPAGIDINFGCPVKKVIKQGSGCDLMRNPKHARKIIQSVTENTSLPVSIKIRSGIDDVSAFDFLDEVGDLPWQTIIVHARSYSQGFSGPIDLNMIRRIKERYPDRIVIANGGIFSPETAKEVLDKSGADGLAIARGCLGNPWLFGQIKSYRETGIYSRPSLEEIAQTAIHHSELMHNILGPQSLIEMRKHLSWYFKGIENARELRKQLLTITSLEDIKKVFVQFIL